MITLFYISEMNEQVKSCLHDYQKNSPRQTLEFLMRIQSTDDTNTGIHYML